MIDYVEFRRRAFEEYMNAWLELPHCVPLEELEKRFLSYVKRNFWLSKVLPYFLLKKWRLKWWRNTLAQVIHFFPLYDIDEGAACDLLVNKNKLYGCKGLHSLGTLGIAVRTMDKIYRMINIKKEPGLRINPVYQEEGSKDTILDMGNYCVLAILLCEGELD